MAAKYFAGAQMVGGAAIRATRTASLSHIQKDAWMGIPQLHTGLGTGAEHTAVFIEVFGQQLDAGGGGRSCVAHNVISSKVTQTDPPHIAAPTQGVTWQSAHPRDCRGLLVQSVRLVSKPCNAAQKSTNMNK